MASKEFSKTLKELRIRAGYTQKQVYGHFNIPQSTFSSWEVGKSEPSGDMLIKLCDFYKSDMMKEFSEINDSNLTYAETKIIEKYRYLAKHSPTGKEMVDYTLNREYQIAGILEEQIQGSEMPTRFITYYHRLALAGTGQVVFENPPTQLIEIPAIPKYRTVSYAIGVDDHSMEPLYKDGDVLLVEMTNTIDVGEIGVFMVDGQSYVKKLGKDELISINDDYDNLPLSEAPRYMGRVVDSLEQKSRH